MRDRLSKYNELVAVEGVGKPGQLAVQLLVVLPQQQVAGHPVYRKVDLRPGLLAPEVPVVLHPEDQHQQHHL